MEVGQGYNRRRRLARQPDRGEIALKEGGVKSDERTFDVNLMELLDGLLGCFEDTASGIATAS